MQAIKDHFVELLSMEAPEDDSTLVQPEKELPSLTATSFWDVAAPSYLASDVAQIECKSRNDPTNGDPKKSTTTNFNGVVAGIVLLIAIILGSLFYARSSG